MDLYWEKRDTMMSLDNIFNIEHENKVSLLLCFLGMHSSYICIIMSSNIYLKNEK